MGRNVLTNGDDQRVSYNTRPLQVQIGDLNKLQTVTKKSTVEAINELKNAKEDTSYIGDLTELNTSDKTNLVAAINSNASDLADKANQSDLDSTNNEVALKADKTYVDTQIQSVASGSPKGVYATLSALQTAFPIGNTNIYLVSANGNWYYWNGSAWTSGGVYQSTGIADFGITRSKIAINAVDVEQTNFLQRGINLFNKNTVTLGYFVNNSNGTLQANSNYDASDYIPVSPTENYTIQMGQYYAFYDIDKNYVSGGNQTSSITTITIPSNAYYMRVTVSLVNNKLDTYMVVKGSSMPSTYSPYTNFIIQNTNINPKSITENEISDKSITPSIVSDMIPKYSLGKNLFNKSTITSGYFVNWSNGTIQTNSLYWSSDYIEVNPNTTYITSSDTDMSFYDSNKTFISGHQKGTGYQSFTTPSNASYIRVSDVSDVNQFQVETGSTVTAYESYRYTLFPVSGIPIVIPKNFVGSSGNWTNKKWSQLGDSITEQDKWQPYVTSKIELQGFNNGIGGTTVVDSDGTDTTAMCRDERINALDSTSDLITFMGGMNDWAQNKPLGAITDSVTSTFYGALNTMSKKLITRFPNSRIVYMTTSFGKYPNRSAFTDSYGLVNTQGLTTGDYGKAIIEVTRLYGIPCLDVYGNAGWNDINIADYCVTETDGAMIHPNDSGARRIAEILIGLLKSLEPIS